MKQQSKTVKSHKRTTLTAKQFSKGYRKYNRDNIPNVKKFKPLAKAIKLGRINNRSKYNPVLCKKLGKR